MEIKDQVRGFHLIRFETSFGEVPLFVNEEFASGPKASIFIGPNGSGKSRVLAAIVDELTNLHQILLKRSRSQEDYGDSRRLRLIPTDSSIDLPSEKIGKVPQGKESFDSKVTYWMDGDLWQIERKDQTLLISRNGNKASDMELRFPDRVLAIAHLPLDKFRFAKRTEDGFYAYLGLRQSTNMTSTGSIETKALFNFIQAATKSSAQSLIDDWLPNLGLELPVLADIALEPRRIDEVSDFAEFMESSLKHLAARYGANRRGIIDTDNRVTEDLERFWPFFKKLRQERLVGKGLKGQRYQFEILPSLSGLVGDAEDVVPMLQLGKRLRILGDFRLRFHKLGNVFGFDDLSSGEQQVLSTVTELVANLGQTSAVFIDEPEISLHPAWQRQYVPSLLSTLRAFPSTHVVIATHSHFLVSDIHPSEGSLTISGHGKGAAFEAYDGEVFGRSPENILYRVFGIGSSGNRYVEQDLTVALQMISGRLDADLGKLEAIHDRLLPLSGNDNPALGKILTSIRAFLDGYSDA